MSKVKVGSFCFVGVPHSAERKTYGQEGKELMNFKLHEKQFVKTFSTTVMDAVDMAVLNNNVLWVFGDIIEAPGYGDKSDQTYTNYDATAAMFDKASVRGEDTKKSDLPF